MSTIICHACSDVPQLESLSHVFMHCPVVQPAVVWLQDLWARLVPGSRLPRSGRQGAGCW
jgi:hypothetical protein